MQLTRLVNRAVSTVRGTRLFLVALLGSVVFVIGCGGEEQAQESPGETQETPARTAEQTEQDTSAQRTEGTEMNSGTVGESSVQEVMLEIEGDPGTEFSGVCSVGDRQEELVGETPQSFVYDLPEDQKLDCEIRKSDQGSGSLKVVLTAPGNTIIQQTNTPGGSINLSFSESGVTSSSSSASSSSVIQQSSSSVVNSSSSSAISSSSSSR